MLGGIASGPDDVLPGPDRVGSALRSARRSRRLTLAQVADGVGLTKGYLSKVERGLAAPSVGTLIKLCEILEVPVGSLFDGGATGAVVRADAYPQVRFGGTGLAEFLLTPAGERRMQVLLSEIEPGGGSGDEAYELPADVSFVLVQRGTLHLAFPPERSVDLGEGDALTFDPGAPHTFRAGPDGARVLWVMAPALPAGDRSSVR
ncbi:Transcriptional regulator, XRE family OS=Tsukamurella paurometabola (strain ATCC 8368 / DSM/ CCUG 35730 / CIP 100753 / JCM 10117 / KCTC 9821 / NBRC 16120/ NCIMB 702349 / NCTC 13040) OX=521096 GN=Tpau_1418 PE=4 SV=1 [Tsukamurella paurometabola]|uniref:Transcriptional regulator, XRE family n=1 Tax=Tsukamurella paurometabola (strain ATCC 8368 / DSM 20162 / CCUG 35730 / CIP 100753 / JCM 10117 / KCTC 9821 / NBRC 16120 / NCIMB 702349 / NCTC 13040) TaxID=521096 RepID=D5UXF4_TSUPD|nr:XRE family transcriptional regulator [Tsukamurella paurometabola]ADG78046.1 transcriptional regulator, XRE family [Tsukamurella paurometabola DSM 20162]SUP29929.1 HTH-type transcriptional regulator sinR [Tsukamurella paurometabola]